MTKNTPEKHVMNNGQDSWRRAILNGDVAFLPVLLRNGFTPDSPIDDNGRSPLVDLCLLVPDDDRHAEALAETARALVNAGATLNLPDYKGLLPADYALASPNPLVARQVILSTMQNEIYRGLENPYRPQIDVLFCLAMCKPERRALYDNITDNLDVIREALSPEDLKNDPLLMDQDEDNIDFWQTLVLQDIDAYPHESSAMRSQFRKVVALEAQARDENTLEKQVVSIEELAEEKSKYRLLEWRHAQLFYAP